jgi:peptidoglycan/xylan/chitin deacetylase (PgdA/CDA1 family)
MYVEPETFDLHLHFLKQHFDILPVSNLFVRDPSRRMTNLKKHACYLTFDDGWSDFYRYAFPLLVKHRVPATVYLPTGFIGTTKLFWADRFADILGMITHRGIFAKFREYVMRQLPQKNHILSCLPEKFLEDILWELKELRVERITEFLEEIERDFDLSLSAIRNDFLSWEQVEEMRRSGFVTFGSHTESHRILTGLTEDEIYMELHASKQRMIEKGAVEKERISFCYPNGNYNNSAMRQLLIEDYSCAFTTLCGWNRPDTPVFELKRVGLHQDVSHNKKLLAFRIYSALACG